MGCEHPTSARQGGHRTPRRLIAGLALALGLLTATMLAGAPSPVAADTTPSDPLFPAQWSLPVIEVPHAWDITRGDAAIKVAILDTGIAPNPGGINEFQGQLGPGYNAITPGGSTSDDYGMYGWGTIHAGIIGARANNDGMAGVAWKVTLLPVKVCSSTGACAAADVAEGVDWAVNNGADIIQITPPSRNFQNAAVDAAIGRAVAADVLVVSAAGSSSEGMLYPSNLPGVIGVSGLSGNGSALWGGGSQLDVVAPAQTIFSVVAAGCCLGTTGTWSAASQVTGVLVLLLSTGVTPDEATQCLYDGAVDLEPAGWDAKFGHGRVDAYAALQECADGGGSTPPPVATPTWTPTRTPTPPPAATPTRTFTPTRTPTRTPTSANTPANTPTRTPTWTPTRTPTHTPTRTPTSAVNTPTPTRTPTSGSGPTPRPTFWFWIWR